VHEDFSRQHDARMGSDRAFGWVMAAALAIVATAPLRHGLPIRSWALLASAAFAAITAIRPRVLRPLNRVWTRIGLLLNRVTSPVLLAVVYYAAVVPTGLVMRALGRDPMRRARDPRAGSYWITRQSAPGPMTRQF
jgi:hypothetical protein